MYAILDAIEKCYRNESTTCQGHHVEQFRVGDSVTVHIPHKDRAFIDPPHLTCVVVGVLVIAQATYRLRYKAGVLNMCYSASCLERFFWSFIRKLEGASSCTLRQAAKQNSPWSTSSPSSCNCKTLCHTQRCPCRKQRYHAITKATSVLMNHH